ncbi:DUF5590 domain-containing protein [Jeotgalibacillus proteolyticus]|uniref:Cell wall elongation regulator TseB-like domain-containing protein n=1 Tax=Jeotgalibacillus proteolyticus TaxID=2082395 RepID=A0A2S5GE14_9BACL|nr:DUF5590 domain-containing protein [Jeotgalibacillus proteolyticus]PPA71236.1 hypothetical protein C4B60_04005 [Jeotgalibacillus proteolyticus]
MKKRIMIVVLSIFALALIFCVTVYNIAKQPLTSTLEAAEAQVQETVQFEEIEDAYVYNGTEAYTILIGRTDEEDALAAFVPVNPEEEILTRPLSEGISSDEVLSMLYQEDNPSKVLSLKLGYESVGPVWEVVYYDEESTLNYYYVLFDTGEWWRAIRNL